MAVLSYFLHLDQHLAALIHVAGIWAYAALFLVIFCETGLVIFPFLPGDSLIFAAGTLAAHQVLNLPLLGISLFSAAVLGDAVNYAIGASFGRRIMARSSSRLLSRQHLLRANDYFNRYGGKTVIMARFVPIVRTFIPFVAGMSIMNYSRFFIYNATGAFLWVYGLLYISVQFGRLPIIRDNFSWVILAIVFISILIPVVEICWQRFKPSTEG